VTDPLAQSERAVRALDAASDVVELLRILHGALRRAHSETFGDANELAAKLSLHIHVMRHMAEMLRHAIDAQVSGEAQIGRSIAADAGSVTAVARRERG
jgi:hypothetical protein